MATYTVLRTKETKELAEAFEDVLSRGFGDRFASCGAEASAQTRTPAPGLCLMDPSLRWSYTDFETDKEYRRRPSVRAMVRATIKAASTCPGYPSIATFLAGVLAGNPDTGAIDSADCEAITQAFVIGEVLYS